MEVTDQQIRELFYHHTPYGPMNKSGVEYLTSNRICKFSAQDNAWIICVQPVDCMKRLRDKEGKLYRSDSVERQSLPYMQYVFDYAIKKLMDFEGVDKRYAIKKMVEDNTNLRSFFAEVNENMGFFGLAETGYSRTLPTVKRTPPTLPIFTKNHV